MAELGEIALRLVGGPTALLEYGGLRFLTDPTFDPPGSYEPRPGVTMTKRASPAVGPEELPAIDAVLLSHDHHVDNLDRAGRSFLTRVPMVLSTPAGARRLGAPALPLAPWQTQELRRPDGERVTVTAVPAQHGPDGTDHLTGEVTGFYLSSRGLPTVYVSGDNASLQVVRRIIRRLGSAPIAVLHTGAARMPHLGDVDLTLSAVRAVKAARILGAREVIPIHFDGWGHFSEGAAELRAAFQRVGLDWLLRVPQPGQRIVVEPARSLRLAIVGASGTVGRAIVEEALARGHEVTTISRHPLPDATRDGVTSIALDASSGELSGALSGADAVVGSVSGRRDDDPDQIPALAGRLLDAVRAACVPRLLWVGGAGSLNVVPGLRLADTPVFPAEVRPESLAQADALELLRGNHTDVGWSYFSPAAELELDADGGETYLVAATDELLRDEDGRSRIALADYARAAVDELEAPQFDRTRFTIAAQATPGPDSTDTTVAVLAAHAW